MKQHWVLDALEKAARERVRDEMAAGDAVMVFGLTVNRIRLLRDFYEARSGKPAAEITPAEVAVPRAAPAGDGIAPTEAVQALQQWENEGGR